MDKSKKYLITSALPYANGELHLGHLSGAYLPADIYVRYLRLRGADVAFICGSDEHGAAITMRAKKEGISPKEIVDKYHELNKETFKRLGISFDYYHRTSDPLHHQTSQDFFKTLIEKGGELEERTNLQYFDEQYNQFLADRYIIGECPKCGNPEAYGDQCERCGSTLSPNELIHPKSTLSGTTPVLRETSHWFFRLDKHGDWLREWIEKGTIEGEFHHDPKTWKNHVVGQCLSWLNDGEGLLPRSITRDLDWGIPVPMPGADGKVLYVWFDAPIGYISSTKQWALENGKNWEDYWKSYKIIFSKKAQRILGINPYKNSRFDIFGREYRYSYGPTKVKNNVNLVHFIGKDNIVFHCIVFPAMLKAHGKYALPVNVPANQFLNFEGRKFSKSKGWGIEQHQYLDEFADFPNKEDALRWALIRNMPENKDSDFKWDEFVDFHDKDLADNLGNFVNRVVTLTNSYFEGMSPGIGRQETFIDLNRQIVREENLLDVKPYSYASHVNTIKASLCKGIEHFHFKEAANDLMELTTLGNQYLQFIAPWTLRKVNSNDPMIAECISFCLDLVVLLSVFCEPFIPNTSLRIRSLLNMPTLKNGDWDEIMEHFERGLPLLPAGHKIGQPEILFAKIHDRKDDSRLKIIERQKAKLGEVLAAEETTELAVPEPTASPIIQQFQPLQPEIQYDDFAKLDIRTAIILAAEAVPKADKLLKLTVDLGFEQRTVVSGIAQHFRPEEVVGKRVLLLANLAPRKLRGVESQGMILMAEDAEGKLGFVGAGEGWGAGLTVK